MDKTIRELFEQAETKEHGYYFFDRAKFAELLIKECIALADKESERYSSLDQEYCSMAMDNYRELIRLHFGIKE